MRYSRMALSMRLRSSTFCAKMYHVNAVIATSTSYAHKQYPIAAVVHAITDSQLVLVCSALYAPCC
jgi:hypothetical protein